MHASVFSLRELFMLGQFEPANIQRDYQWGENQWAALLDDLSAALTRSGFTEPAAMPAEQADQAEDGPDDVNEGDPVQPEWAARTTALPNEIESSYYLGHIILMKRTEKGRFFVFDGQQRFLTLTILLAALRDRIGDQGNWEETQRTIRDEANNSRVRLKAAQAILTNVVAYLGGARDIAAQPIAGSPVQQRLRQCARFFVRTLLGWSEARTAALGRFLLDDVHVTTTTMTERRVAQRAYTTINSRGAPLQQKDMIKAHLTQRAQEHAGTLEAGNRVTEGWDRLERHARRHVDRIIAISLHLHFGRSAGGNAYDAVIEEFGSAYRAANIVSWIEGDLFGVWNDYKASVLDAANPDNLVQPMADIRRMSFLPWWQWQSLLIQMFRIRNTTTRSNYIHKLMQWCFSVNLLGLGEDQIESAILQAIDRLKNNTSPFSSHGLKLSNTYKDRVRSRLEDGQISSMERRGAHVRWLETLFGDQTNVDFRATNNTSVEHVLPQRPTGQWLEDFPANPHIHSELFGNLCMLPKRLGDELGNSQYAVKRPAYLALPDHYRSAHEVAAQEHWKMATLQDRNAVMKARALKALGIANQA